AVRHRSRAFRDHHDPQPGDRVAHAAGRTDHGRGLRDRPCEHGGGVAQHPGFLYPDADRARTRDRSPGTDSLSPEYGVEIDLPAALQAPAIFVLTNRAQRDVTA